MCEKLTPHQTIRWTFDSPQALGTLPKKAKLSHHSWINMSAASPSVPD